MKLLLIVSIAGLTLSAQEPQVSRGSRAVAQATPPPVEAVEPQTAERVRLRRSIVRVAQDYTLPANHSVPYIQLFFGQLTLEGLVRGDVVVTMGSVRLAPSAVVEQSLVVIGGSAVIEPGARVARDLVVLGGTVTAPPDFSPEGDHVVVGNRWLGGSLHNLLPWVTRGLLLGRPIVPGLDWVWSVVAVFFFLYLAVNLVFDRGVAASADAMVERPLSVFMTGFMVLLLTIPALVVVAATVVGVLIIPFLLCALVVVAVVGKTGVARALGRTIVRPETEGRLHGLAAFILGFALLTLAYMVPVIGFVTWALTTVLGLGAAFIVFRRYLRRERRTATSAPVAPVPVAAVSAGSMTVDAPEIPLRSAGSPEVPLPTAIPPAASEQAARNPPPPLFDQGYARYPRGTFLDRLAAFVLDCILVGIICGLLDVNRDGAYFFLLLAYHVAFWAWKGTTIGGIVCGLRVVRTHGVELRFVDALVRGLSGVLSIVALGLGCFWMIQDRERQMWHDKMAGTLVVKVPRDALLP